MDRCLRDFASSFRRQFRGSSLAAFCGAAGTGWIVAVMGKIGTVTINSFVTQPDGTILRPDAPTLVEVVSSGASGVMLTLGDAVAQ